MNVLPKFIKVCNYTVQSTTGVAASRVTDVDVLAIWRRMEPKRQRVRVATNSFRVGQYVRISKKKIKLAKAAEHNFSTEISRIVKIIDRRLLADDELEDGR